jgi:penicillin-binding protein 2
MGFEPKIWKEVKRGMVQVVSDAHGTAGKASVPNVKVAGKTGTAQWGPKSKERTAAWFSGFAPADKPKYAFAALFESDASNAEVHGGTVAAPLIGTVLREVFKDEAKEKKKKKKGEKPDDEEMEVRRAEPVEPRQETPRD